MKTFKLLEIMPKYEKCPSYGNTTIGNGQGGIIVEDNTFTSS
jgi:hypothetical protein